MYFSKTKWVLQIVNKKNGVKTMKVSLRNLLKVGGKVGEMIAKNNKLSIKKAKGE